MKVLYQAKASATGGRNGHVASSDGVLDLQLAIPKGLGGPGGEKTNPEQLFAAGYAACFDSALNFVGMRQKISLRGTRVDATVEIGQREAGGFGLAVRLDVTIPDVPREQAEALMEAAHAACPYSNAVRGNVDVELALV
jgi:osmotically inducible protein OsmC